MAANMTREAAQRFLERYVETGHRIFAAHDALEQLQANFEGRFSAVTGAPARDSVAAVADAEEIVAAMKREIRGEIAAMARARREIRRAIDTLDQPTQRTVLELRYLNGWDWKRIAARLHFGMRTVLRHHTAALEKLAHNGTWFSCIMVPEDIPDEGEGDVREADGQGVGKGAGGRRCGGPHGHEPDGPRGSVPVGSPDAGAGCCGGRCCHADGGLRCHTIELRRGL